MHPSSMINMRKARIEISHIIGKNLDILDVGGRSLDLKVKDRSYQEIWKDLARNYYIADIADGPGVTHVMQKQYSLPFDNCSIDLIVSGQTLEHVKNPFRLVKEMVRVLDQNNYIILIAPSTGPRHDKKDYWRFMDDAFSAIAEESGLTTVIDYIDNEAQDARSARWKDHVFIGQKIWKGR